MARFLADLEGKKKAEYKIHTLAGTIIPVVKEEIVRQRATLKCTLSGRSETCRRSAVDRASRSFTSTHGRASAVFKVRFRFSRVLTVQP